MNLKKIVAAGVAAVCAVSMAACGGSNDSSGVTDLTYDKIKLGETGKDITASIKFYNGRTDMGLLSGQELEVLHRRLQQDLSEHQGRGPDRHQLRG